MTLQCTQQWFYLNIYFSPVVEVIIGERVEIVFNHVVVSHGLINARLLRAYGLWDGLDVLSLFGEVFDGVGPLPQLVGDLLEVITDLHMHCERIYGRV